MCCKATITKRRKKWPFAISSLLIASFLAPLLAWAYISRFTRYWSDDFCYSSMLCKIGFLRSQVYWYTHWTGRYSFIFTNTALQLIGPRTAHVTASILLLVWLATAVWAIYQLVSLVRLPSPL